MADKSLKNSKNVDGTYYVDSNCIGCGQCMGIAEEFFADNSDEGNCYVKEQPKSAEDVALCEKALCNCPVEAIGNDGE